MIETFFACDCVPMCLVFARNNQAGSSLTEWPELVAISRRFEKTYGTVRGFGLKIVFWLFFEFWRNNFSRLANLIQR